jgi:hypothetical protein
MGCVTVLVADSRLQVASSFLMQLFVNFISTNEYISGDAYSRLQALIRTFCLISPGIR